MNREELIKEIDNATKAMRIITRVVNEALCHSRHYKSNEETEEAYNKGSEDVWKFLKAFCGMDVGKRQKVFGEYVVGKLVENMSPQEAFAILEAYEKEQNEIKVGDVVFGDDEPDVYGIVTFVSCEMIYIVWSDGSSGVEYDFRDIKKTGKHIDITSVLEQLRGGMSMTDINMTTEDVMCAINNLKGMYQSSLDKDETYLFAIQALSEIQQYKTIGTVEQFKALKENSFFNFDSPFIRVDKKSYDKAIDEFTDKMIIMMPGHRQDVEQIAEQLKAGGK